MTNIKCPECGSSNIVKKGTTLNRYGRVQNHKCKECARIFIGAIIEDKQEEN